MDEMKVSKHTIQHISWDGNIYYRFDSLNWFHGKLNERLERVSESLVESCEARYVEEAKNLHPQFHDIEIGANTVSFMFCYHIRKFRETEDGDTDKYIFDWIQSKAESLDEAGHEIFKIRTDSLRSEFANRVNINKALYPTL